MSSSLYSRDEPERSSIGFLLVRTIAWAVLFGLTIVIGMAGIVPHLLGATTQPMRTGALEPSISQGDLVVTEPIDPLSVKADDIITFRPSEGTPAITRRVVAVEPVDAALPDATQTQSTEAVGDPRVEIVTSGDLSTPEYRVDPAQVTGKVIYTLPFAGIFSMEALGANPVLVVLGAVLVLGVLLNIRSRQVRRKT